MANVVGPGMSYGTQKSAITSATSGLDIEFTFSEEDCRVAKAQGKAMRLLFTHLNAGDKIYIYSWACLIRDLDSLPFDVCEFMNKIGKSKINCYFVLEKIDTSLPKDRLVLGNTVLNAQYQRDISQSTQTQDSPCSSSNCNAKAVQSPSK